MAAEVLGNAALTLVNLDETYIVSLSCESTGVLSDASGAASFVQDSVFTIVSVSHGDKKLTAGTEFWIDATPMGCACSIKNNNKVTVTEISSNTASIVINAYSDSGHKSLIGSKIFSIYVSTDKKVIVSGQQFFKKNKGESAYVPKSITLKAALYGGLTDCQWYKNGTLLINETGQTIIVEPDDKTNNNNQSIYKCQSGSFYDEITITNITDGADGDLVEIVLFYQLYDSKQTSFATPEYDPSTKTLTLNGWSTSPQDVTSSYPYEYMTQSRKTTTSSAVVSYDAFSTPVLWKSNDSTDVFEVLTSGGTKYGMFTASNGSLYANMGYLNTGTLSIRGNQAHSANDAYTWSFAEPEYTAKGNGITYHEKIYRTIQYVMSGHVYSGKSPTGNGIGGWGTPIAYLTADGTYPGLYRDRLFYVYKRFKTAPSANMSGPGEYVICDKMLWDVWQNTGWRPDRQADGWTDVRHGVSDEYPYEALEVVTARYQYDSYNLCWNLYSLGICSLPKLIPSVDNVREGAFKEYVLYTRVLDSSIDIAIDGNYPGESQLFMADADSRMIKIGDAISVTPTETLINASVIKTGSLSIGENGKVFNVNADDKTVNIGDGAITVNSSGLAAINASRITSGKLAVGTNGKVFSVNADDKTVNIGDGAITVNSSGLAAINASSITSGKLAVGDVFSADINNGTVSIGGYDVSGNSFTSEETMYFMRILKTGSTFDNAMAIYIRPTVMGVYFAGVSGKLCSMTDDSVSDFIDLQAFEQQNLEVYKSNDIRYNVLYDISENTRILSNDDICGTIKMTSSFTIGTSQITNTAVIEIDRTDRSISVTSGGTTTTYNPYDKIIVPNVCEMYIAYKEVYYIDTSEKTSYIEMNTSYKKDYALIIGDKDPDAAGFYVTKDGSAKITGFVNATVVASKYGHFDTLYDNNQHKMINFDSDGTTQIVGNCSIGTVTNQTYDVVTEFTKSKKIVTSLGSEYGHDLGYATTYIWYIPLTNTTSSVYINSLKVTHGSSSYRYKFAISSSSLFPSNPITFSSSDDKVFLDSISQYNAFKMSSYKSTDGGYWLVLGIEVTSMSANNAPIITIDSSVSLKKITSTTSTRLYGNTYVGNMLTPLSTIISDIATAIGKTWY